MFNRQVHLPALRGLLPRIAIATLIPAALGAATLGTAHADTVTAHAKTASASMPDGPPGTNAGPPYEFQTELMSFAPYLGLKDKMILKRTKLGYRLWSGQQDSHLVVTLVDDGHSIQFVDSGTKYFKRLAKVCHRIKEGQGVGAVCPVPGNITVEQPLLIEDWPRLGDDYLDTSSLPATFSATMLSDEGDDVAYFGAGRDFFNGHLGADKVWAGDGNDWIRNGNNAGDFADAGPGDDDIVAQDGGDTMIGGPGLDRIWGGSGNDDLTGGDDADLLICGDGDDTASGDIFDRISQNCENVTR